MASARDTLALGRERGRVPGFAWGDSAQLMVFEPASRWAVALGAKMRPRHLLAASMAALGSLGADVSAGAIEIQREDFSTLAIDIDFV